jgi:hypothetical protein
MIRYPPKTFKAILDNLPAEVSINKWGEELYTDRTTIAIGHEDNAKTEINELDVAYWPEGHLYNWNLNRSSTYCIAI